MKYSDCSASQWPVENLNNNLSANQTRSTKICCSIFYYTGRPTDIYRTENRWFPLNPVPFCINEHIHICTLWLFQPKLACFPPYLWSHFVHLGLKHMELLSLVFFFSTIYLTRPAIFYILMKTNYWCELMKLFQHKGRKARRHISSRGLIHLCSFQGDLVSCVMRLMLQLTDPNSVSVKHPQLLRYYVAV